MKTALALDQLLVPARFQPLLLALYGPELMPMHSAVLVSQWSKYYFAMIWRRLLEGAALPVFTACEVTLDNRGLPLALSESGPHCAGVEALLGQHLQPVVSRLAGLGPVAAAVLWGNAGDCLDQALASDERDHRDLRQLLNSPASPLYLAVSLDAAGKRRRRTCCLSYKVDWVGHCEYCPLLT